MKHIIVAAVLFATTPAWANPPGYDSSWTSKEAADAAMEADHAYTDCTFHHLSNHAKKTVEPARTVVKAAHAACWFEHTQLGSAMHKAQPSWRADWLEKRDKEVEPDETAIVLEAPSE